MKYLEINKKFKKEEKKYTLLSPDDYYDCIGQNIDYYGYTIFYNPKNKEIFNLLNKPDINGNKQLPPNVGGLIYGGTLSQTGNCLVDQSCYLCGNIQIENNAQILDDTRIEFRSFKTPEVIIKDNVKLVNCHMSEGMFVLDRPGLDDSNNSILILDNTILTHSFCSLYTSTNSLLVYSGTTDIDNTRINICGDSIKIVFYNTYIQNKSEERYEIIITFVESFQCIGKYLVFTNNSIKKYIDNVRPLTLSKNYNYYRGFDEVPEVNTITIWDDEQNKPYTYNLTEFIKTYT